MEFSSSARKAVLVFLLTLPVFGSGCTLCDNAWRTTVAEPFHYSNYWYEKFARARFRGLAHCAFDQERALTRAERDDYCHEPFTVDHKLGFVDGFVDYLEAGGMGHPPPLPPRRYWKAKYQTPDGYRATEDWFRGYHHGTMSARASGYRQLVTVPVSDALVSNTLPYPYRPTLTLEQQAEKDDGDDDDDDDRLASRSKFDNRPTIVPHLTRLPPVSDSQY